MKKQEKNALSLRGYMLCYHQMHDWTPWFGPSAEALPELLDAMQEVRLNTLLVEYETYFPWSGRLAPIKCKDAFTKSQIGDLRKACATRGSELVPLVQVLGHVYHILIHPEFRACAEDAKLTQQLCPLAEESFELAKELIDQTLRLHPECRHLHIGGDECRMLGHCPRCRAYAKKHGFGALFGNYMARVANYVLSKGVTPIMWHDIALNHPECLDLFDKRVLFNFWNYGTASHGDAEWELGRLLARVPASRVICSPGARIEAQNGAIHHFPSLTEANILKLNKLAKDKGALGTILTDWPDTGCSFYDSRYALRAQGKASTTGGASLRLFRQNYAKKFLGTDIPGLVDKLDAIAGSTLSARGFPYHRGHFLDRYAWIPYDFDELVRTVQASRASGEGHLVLFRQAGQLAAAQNLRECMEAALPRCSRNLHEANWYRLLALLTETFVTVDMALRKECLVTADGTKLPEPTALRRYESREYAQKALALLDESEKAWLAFHKGLAAERPLRNHAKELFPKALRDGLKNFITNGFTTGNKETKK